MSKWTLRNSIQFVLFCTMSNHPNFCSGQNGAGKTTLMNAINNGKLEGWPFHLRTQYVDSGSNVDPVHEAKKVFDELLTSGASKEDCEAMLKQLKAAKKAEANAAV